LSAASGRCTERHFSKSLNGLRARSAFAAQEEARSVPLSFNFSFYLKGNKRNKEERKMEISCTTGACAVPLCAPEAGRSGTSGSLGLTIGAKLDDRVLLGAGRCGSGASAQYP